MPKTRILVVDDDCIERDRLIKILHGRACVVRVFDNGHAALRFLPNRPPPDILVVDLASPVMDTARFLHELDQLSLEPRPWIILATSSPDITREWAANHRCGGFLRKPVDETQLFDEIERCLNGTAETEVF